MAARPAPGRERPRDGDLGRVTRDPGSVGDRPREDSPRAGGRPALRCATLAPGRGPERPCGASAPMNLSAGVAVHLLGRPRIEVDGASGYRFRSRKSWALLAFLLLAERPPTRSRLASLLFAEADDPLRALRWCLAEVRRGLGPGGRARRRPGRADAAAGCAGRCRRAGPRALERGDPAAGPRAGPARRAGHRRTPSRSRPGCSPSAGASRRRRSPSSTRPRWGCWRAESSERARELAVRATVMSPLDENHQALLIRHLPAGRRRGGGRRASSTPGRPPPSASSARRPAPRSCWRCGSGRAAAQAVDPTSIRAVTEGGAAAVSAGALAAGVASFEAAVRMADQPGADSVARRDPAGAGGGADPHAWAASTRRGWRR